MESNMQSSKYSLVAGILFALLALIQLSSLTTYFTFISLLWLLAYAFAAVAAFMGQRNILPAASLGALAVLSLISFLRTLTNAFLLTNLLGLAAAALAGLLLLAFFTDYLPQYKEQLRKLWFLPGVLSAAAALINLVIYASYGYYPISFLFTLLLGDLLCAAALLFVGLWAVDDGTVKQRTAAPAPSAASSSAAPVSEEYGECYHSLVTHILLLLFTCGIWMYIWIYRTTKYLNCVKDEEYRNPTTKLLLCMFVPFYSIYWIYKSAQRIDKLAASKGISSELSTLCLILAIFVGIIPPILMQDKLNNIATAGTARAAAPQSAPVTPAPAASVAEELKAYKELLDSGIITQEEFEAKKKQLLNL